MPCRPNVATRPRATRGAKFLCRPHYASYTVHFVRKSHFALYMMHTTLEDIGATIAQARKASKRSQAALAGALGMSRATISGIENGTIPEVGVRKLIALCGALGL